jgi:hypothetical protein
VDSVYAFVVILLAASPDALWTGTVLVDRMIHEPGGYHPYKSTITLNLREGERLAVPGGFRIALVSDRSVNTVETSVHQGDGPMLCSGTGTEALPARSIGYLETKAGKTTYHLAIPRAFGAFACGRNHSTNADRRVIVGAGDPEPAEVETADTAIRASGRDGSVMAGAFESKKTRPSGTQSIRYEYKVSWSITRQTLP